ncbi:MULTISPECIES: class I SAM-dependent methyltransferase [Streptomyces]|uniref:Class I SAM-dependent methyltransferase n=1 Tax=Streptomyces katrae TaxID=68223 RepID=A0ABT7GZC0_9ACTN|nr:MULTISPECIES: class I SAM-dependent methyltransferase [Streptomyces]MDK9498214.1 class I SAM-dependent methyltransferase [Streptomyces katrae]RST00472.1 class I SAM-dependent methyltransferase [Streptomyces sp. WAC07149]GLX20639.1 methyltransferase [Streptomyces lavendulae subsp. lavendulae]GLX28199.1 methyltransferase [Streptomyces lavendulae subsp. lavendulae]
MDSATTYDALADVYDLMYPPASPDISDAVAFIADLAPEGGRVLELGVGNGRIAIPLAERGLAVHGIDGSEHMLEKLAARDPEGKVATTAADFTTGGTGEQFDVVFIALNTFFAPTTADAQVQCMQRMREQLAPGGRVVIEAFEPRAFHQQEGEKTSTRYLSPTSVMVDSTHVMRDRQLILVIHTVVDGGVPRPTQEVIRYAWPTEIDLMARLAGLRLVERHGGWRGEAFDANSHRHVSVYEAVEDPK